MVFLRIVVPISMKPISSIFLRLFTLLPVFASLHAAEKPNIIVIMSDDVGYSDVGCYGGEIQTPTLDSLAEGGVRFTQFYNTARCWPSRACILTGYYAPSIRRDSISGAEVASPGGTSGVRPRWAQLLSEQLKPLGYHSYHSGKWHVDGDPRDNGFDHS